MPALNAKAPKVPQAVSRTDPTIAPVPSSESVYERIREAILDHRLSPRTKLKEVALAELFGVTRSAVRHAFARLHAMKLIELRPNRGAIVASPSIAESRDLFAARRTIEGAIVDKLAREVSTQQVKELRKMVQREDHAYRHGEMREGLKLSVDFHRVIATMAGNTVFAEVLDQMVSRTPLVVAAYRDATRTNACANREHADLVDAIAAHDADAAVRIMKCHLCSLESQLNFADDTPANELANIFGLDARSSKMPPRRSQV